MKSKLVFIGHSFVALFACVVMGLILLYWIAAILGAIIMVFA